MREVSCETHDYFLYKWTSPSDRLRAIVDDLVSRHSKLVADNPYTDGDGNYSVYLKAEDNDHYAFELYLENGCLCIDLCFNEEGRWSNVKTLLNMDSDFIVSLEDASAEWTTVRFVYTEVGLWQTITIINGRRDNTVPDLGFVDKFYAPTYICSLGFCTMIDSFTEEQFEGCVCGVFQSGSPVSEIYVCDQNNKNRKLSENTRKLPSGERFKSTIVPVRWFKRDTADPSKTDGAYDFYGWMSDELFLYKIWDGYGFYKHPGYTDIGCYPILRMGDQAFMHWSDDYFIRLTDM